MGLLGLVPCTHTVIGRYSVWRRPQLSVIGATVDLGSSLRTFDNRGESLGSCPAVRFAHRAVSGDDVNWCLRPAPVTRGYRQPLGVPREGKGLAGVSVQLQGRAEGVVAVVGALGVPVECSRWARGGGIAQCKVRSAC